MTNGIPVLDTQFRRIKKTQGEVLDCTLHLRGHVGFAGLEINRKRYMLMNDFPLAVCLAPKIGLPEGHIDWFPIGTLGGIVLHAAGQSELTVADHLQFEEINFYVLYSRKLRKVIVNRLLAHEIRRRPIMSKSPTSLPSA